ncbi:MAG: DUF560 domain-containing protein [Sphingomonadales bacterium]|nr:MAG: DUF560 domain-containing protein [Sphingomonadales bacterium]
MAAQPAWAEDACPAGNICMTGMKGRDVLQMVEQLVLDGRYNDAKPLLAALAQDPTLDFERRFMLGYIAAQEGDNKSAIKHFRGLLVARPNEPRVRLELARALYLDGQPRAADYHFRLAEDADLPEDIRQTVRTIRRSIRANKSFYGTFRLGIAPDTNVNSATSDRTVELFGLPFVLSDDARQRTGLGQTASVQAGGRIALSPTWAINVDAQSLATNYRGTANDDIIAAVSAGPSLTLGPWRVGVAASTTQRIYGARLTSQLYGPRLTLERVFKDGAQAGVEVAARRVDNRVSNDYDGWQYTAAASYDRVIAGSLLVSGGLFGRYEPVASRALSSTETGVSLGIGGELPWGVNAGISVQASRSWFGATLDAFGERRKDWRIDGRIYAGLRSLRWWGFSPALEYRYTRVDSSIPLYDFDRHRVDLTVERYF